MRYSVDPAAVRDDSGEVARALEVVATLPVTEDLAPLGTAFAGGATAAAVGRICGLWGIQLARARGELAALRGALAEAADGYAAIDAAAGRVVGDVAGSASWAG